MIEPIFLSKPWLEDSSATCSKLETRSEGLSEEEVAERTKLYGVNTLPAKETTGMFRMLWRQAANPLIVILIAAAILSGILGDVVEVVVILLAVGVNVGLGFYREYSAETTIERLANYVRERARVVRAGQEREIDSSELVPGDIIRISYGSRLPADAIIVSANGLRVDEAVLTGESVAVAKRPGVVAHDGAIGDRFCVAHAGTLAVEGYGTAVVFATGANTEIGRIAGIVSSTDRVATPIERGVDKLAWVITVVVSVVVIAVFILGVSRGELVTEMLTLSAAVAVGAVPEALPIALTIILAIGAERIAARKGVVRTLAAAETLGSTTLVMTDKTGTLTLADMRLVGAHPVTSILAGESDHDLSDFDLKRTNLIESAVRNLDVVVENPGASPGEWIIRGRPLEVNVARVAAKYNIALDTLRTRVGHIVVPFSSAHKFSVSESEGEYIVMGAPDVLLARSTVGEHEANIIERWIERESEAGKRIVGLARRTALHSQEVTYHDIKDLEFVGVLAFRDPIREDVPAAIETIRSYGIDVALVTGDLKGTAIAVAQELGWHIDAGSVLTGAQIKDMSDEELSERVKTARIFARVTPEDKLRIGRAFRTHGEVVAMTGDGVNDAPALKAMDIGISLGSGSDVAKSVANLVLLDDSFKTIGMAVGEGRKILANIRKTFVYLMSNSLDGVFLIGGSLVFGLPMPLTALQIIWANLFTGSLPALAFAFDEDLDGKHVGTPARSKSVFTSEVTSLTFGVGITSSLLLFAVYFGLIRNGVDIELSKSITFACFASYILVIAYSFRSLKRTLFTYPLFSNGKLNAAIAVAGIVLIGTYTIEPIRTVFELAPIPPVWIGFIAGWLVFNVFFVECAKWIVRSKR
jgi:Ca2+-transporting ATPase